DAYDCAQGADAVVIVTEWNAFRALDFARLRAAMTAPVMVDLRNVYKADEATRHGFRYAGIGGRRELPVSAPQLSAPQLSAPDAPVTAAAPAPEVVRA
ncbi:UDP binding domain-containing protein, partial [Methylobacterium sp. J-068]|uniref:UDP binding domain-containing protein n=1 Tax=Methylobacterium sp. J-068 TaxID=2836649 RepID=UPI001FBABCF6